MPRCSSTTEGDVMCSLSRSRRRVKLATLSNSISQATDPVPRRLLAFFFLNDAAPPEFSPLPLPDPLPTYPPPAVGAAEVERAFLHREPPRHLAHRREERQAPVGALDRLVGDRDRARVAERPRQLGRRQIGRAHV